MLEEAIIGEVLKYRVDITASGFDMGVDDYVIELSCAGITKTLDRSDVRHDVESDAYYIIIDTSEFRSGVLSATVTAQVPDSDAPDGIRAEKARIELKRLRTR